MRILMTNVSTERFGTLCPVTICPNSPLRCFSGLTNGELLTAAETAKFDVFLTVDRGIEYQQNLTGRNIAIITFRQNRPAKGPVTILPVCLAHIESVQPGQIVRIEG